MRSKIMSLTPGLISWNVKTRHFVKWAFMEMSVHSRAFLERNNIRGNIPGRFGGRLMRCKIAHHEWGWRWENLELRMFWMAWPSSQTLVKVSEWPDSITETSGGHVSDVPWSYVVCTLWAWQRELSLVAEKRC